MLLDFKWSWFKLLSKLNAIYSLYRCYIYIHIYAVIYVHMHMKSCLVRMQYPETWKFLKAGNIISPFGHWINWHSFIWFFSVHTVHGRSRLDISLDRSVLFPWTSEKCLLRNHLPVVLFYLSSLVTIGEFLYCCSVGIFFFLITSSEGLRKQFPVYSRTVWFVCKRKCCLVKEAAAGGVFKVKTMACEKDWNWTHLI